VCEEDKDTLLEAWDEDIVEQRKKEAAVSIDFMLLISLHCGLTKEDTKSRQ